MQVDENKPYFLTPITEELLCRLPRYLKNSWYNLNDDTGYFGDGSNGENGIRSNSNVAYSTAVVATYAVEIGVSIEDAKWLTQSCKSVLRYLCRSHVSGNGQCRNGGQWGLEWQSSWWAAKIGMAAHLVWETLDEVDRSSVLRVVVAEADRHLNRIAPTGMHLDTKAEENAWDAEVLATALLLSASHAHAERWQEKFIEFSANVFSTPNDRYNISLLDGKQVNEHVYTCNVHGDFSIENHGAYHFCYVASPLLSKAWCNHALQLKNMKVPDALSHHVLDIWSLAKETFLGNRFAYVSGQDWARYAYGEYFIVPALVYLYGISNDKQTLAILEARLSFIANEARHNENGSFFGSRFTSSRFAGQYGKYETDCFACIALTWCSLQRGKLPAKRPSLSPVVPFKHLSPEGQFCFQRTESCFFSFSWSTLEHIVPNVCLIPNGRDDLAEWHIGNMIGTVTVPDQGATIGVRSMRANDHGIDISGTCLIRSRAGQPLFEHQLSVSFKANEGAVTIKSTFVAKSDLKKATVTGLNWRIPNDIFNGATRTIYYENDSSELRTTTDQCDSKHASDRRSLFMRVVDRVFRIFGKDRSVTSRIHSQWLNIDNRIGIAIVRGAQDFFVRRYNGRQSNWGSLYVDQIESPKRRLFWKCKAGDVLLDTVVIVHAGTALESREISSQL